MLNCSCFADFFLRELCYILQEPNDDGVGDWGSVLSWEGENNDGNGVPPRSRSVEAMSLAFQDKPVSQDSLQLSEEDQQNNFYSNYLQQEGLGEGAMSMQGSGEPFFPQNGKAGSQVGQQFRQLQTNESNKHQECDQAKQSSLPQISLGPCHANQEASEGLQPTQSLQQLRQVDHPQLLQQVRFQDDVRKQHQENPQVQQFQSQYTTDPSILLQQLQIAQLQQQLQFAQAQHQVSQATQQFCGSSVEVDNVQKYRHLNSKPSQNSSILPRPNQCNSDSVQCGSLSRPVDQRNNFGELPQEQSAKMDTVETTGPMHFSISKAPVVVSSSDTDDSNRKRTVPGGKGRVRTTAPAKRAKPQPLDTGNMTEKERVVASRDRNREHARNTRKRKKAYLEELKSTVDQLCRERDSLVSERAAAAKSMVEIHNTRIEVLMSFFALRVANEKNRELWSSILDETCFTSTMPITPYRSFPAYEVQASKCQRYIQGIDGMVADTASLHVLFNSLVDRKKFPEGKVEFRYSLVTDDAVVSGGQMLARWVMKTTNATELGAQVDVSKQGMLCGRFNSAHKITSIDLMFDVMAFMLQLKQAMGADSFAVVPNTVQSCHRKFENPILLMLADAPHTIVQVNKHWEDMTGYIASDVVGKVSFAKLNCSGTDGHAFAKWMEEIHLKRPAAHQLVQAQNSGSHFHSFISAYPLSSDSRITHYLIVAEHYGMGPLPVMTTKLAD